MFTREELEFIRDLCAKWNAFAITDEIYEHILYDGAEHISLASLDGMRERTITINGMSKTYSVTGWRVGWAIASPEATEPIRKVHDFLTVGAAAPLQEAGAVALDLPDSLLPAPGRATTAPGATACSASSSTRASAASSPRRLLHHDGHLALRLRRRRAFARYLVEKIGVAVVPGSSFYNDPADGARQVRFTFCKTRRDARRRRRAPRAAWRVVEPRRPRCARMRRSKPGEEPHGHGI